jgi:hypothetical protein
VRVGPRLALGAKGRDILLQFLTEAALITVIGGVDRLWLRRGRRDLFRLVPGAPGGRDLEALRFE